MNIKTWTLSIVLIFSTNIKGEEFKMIGKSLLEYSIFKIDVYEISYFKSNSSEKLVLDYKTNVKKKYSQKGWMAGLSHKLKLKKYKDKAKWLLDNTVDLKKGDQFTILKKNQKVSLMKNNKLIAEIEDKDISNLAFEPWLGEKPVSLELKNQLLGKKGD